jgi:hypothetical protein
MVRFLSKNPADHDPHAQAWYLKLLCTPIRISEHLKITHSENRLPRTFNKASKKINPVYFHGVMIDIRAWHESCSTLGSRMHHA